MNRSRPSVFSRELRSTRLQETARPGPVTHNLGIVAFSAGLWHCRVPGLDLVRRVRVSAQGDRPDFDGSSVHSIDGLSGLGGIVVVRAIGGSSLGGSRGSDSRRPDHPRGFSPPRVSSPAEQPREGRPSVARDETSGIEGCDECDQRDECDQCDGLPFSRSPGALTRGFSRVGLARIHLSFRGTCRR